eukprot:Amastigsp_a177630_6.p4 type:complete len:115 gc:universal Amastigsp_a177630_6:806-1150(+)
MSLATCGSAATRPWVCSSAATPCPSPRTTKATATTPWRCRFLPPESTPYRSLSARLRARRRLSSSPTTAVRARSARPSRLRACPARRTRTRRRRTRSYAARALSTLAPQAARRR